MRAIPRGVSIRLVALAFSSGNACLGIVEVAAGAGGCIEYPSAFRWVGRQPGDYWRVASAGSLIYAAHQESLTLFDGSDPEALTVRARGAFLPSEIRCVAALGPLAFLGNFHDVVVVDASRPPDIVEIGRLTLPDAISGIAWWQGKLSVAMGHAGLAIVDVEDPRNPRLIGRANTPGISSDVAMLGTVAYVADYDFGVQIIDLVDPAVPAFLGWILPGLPGVHRCSVSQSVLFATRGGTLQAFDLADPARPRLIAVLPPSGVGLAETAKYSGGNVLVATNRGVAAVDMFASASPEVLAFAPLPGSAHDLAVEGSHAFVATSDGFSSVAIGMSGPTGVAARRDAASGFRLESTDEHLFAVTSGGVDLFGIDVPTAPTFLSRLPIDGTQDIALSGPFAYVVSQQESLVVFDVLDPARPTRVGQALVSRGATAVDVEGDWAYVAVGSPRQPFEQVDWGLEVFDCSEPVAPARMTSLSMYDPIQEVDVQGSRALLLSNHELHVVDVSDPLHPTLRGSISIPEIGQRIVADGDLVYVPTSEPSLVIADLSNWDSPTIVARLSLPANGVDVAVDAGIAWVCLSDRGVQVCDVRDPHRPRRIGAVSAESEVSATTAIQVQSGWGYVLAWPELIVLQPACALATPVLIEDFAVERTTIGVEMHCVLNEPVDRLWILRSESLDGSAARMVLESTAPHVGRWAAIDHSARPDIAYAYRILVSSGGEPGGSEWRLTPPLHHQELHVTIEGPAWSPTGFRIQLPRSGGARLELFDVRGRRIRTILSEHLAAGPHRAEWDGRDAVGRPAASGVYVARLSSQGLSATARFTRVR